MEAILEACDYHGPYAGNFIPSLIAIGEAVRDRLGMEYLCAFPYEVRDRPWVARLRRAGIDPVFLADGLGLLPAARELETVARARQVRLIRSHFTRYDLPGGLAARRVGARMIWNIHTGNLEPGLRQKATDLVKVRLAGRALCHRVIGVSEEIAREARMRGYPDRLVSVVLNGIDLSRFEAGDVADSGRARAALGLGDGERVVLGYCWAPFRKGADVIARACAGRDVTALLVGDEELVAFLGGELPPNVRILDPVDDPRELLLAADVFVSASREEAFSYAIGEAMAMRLPVASSDIPGPAAYFDAPGLVTFPSGEAPALAAAVEELLQPGRRAERGEANRRFVAERLGLARHVDAVLAVFEHELDGT